MAIIMAAKIPIKEKAGIPNIINLLYSIKRADDIINAVIIS